MKRFTEARYIPYLRTRYRTRVHYGVPMGMAIKEFFFFFRIVVCITCLVLTIRSASGHFYEAVKNTSEYQAVQLMNTYIDDGVLKTTSNYDDNIFIHIGKNNKGQVISVETNTMEVNRFAAQLSENILEGIKQNEKVRIKAPIGSSSGSGLFSSFGFFIPYRIVPAGKVYVKPESIFKSAGINQTVHRLKMKVIVEVKILFPLMGKVEKMERDILISETVIMGDVPEKIMGINSLGENSLWK